MRLAHLSDLHFAKTSFNPLQFFSKRWIGNFNLIFNRERAFQMSCLSPLPALFKELKVDLAIITGDLTTTSLVREFRAAKDFIEEIEKQGVSVVTVPGNHDQYTKRAYRKQLFYQFFPSDLKKEGLCVQTIAPNWKMITLDMAIATKWTSSQGYFSPELEERLEKTLSTMPDNISLILASHFPFFLPDIERRELVRADALRRLIERFPQIKLYLHGHTHIHSIADLRNNSLPIILDSGSATRAEAGTWNLIDISDKGCEVQVFHHPKNSPWKMAQKMAFRW